MKIGLMGGSFDPVHLGHTSQVIKTIEQLNLDKIIIIPTNHNPWKDKTYSSNQNRIDMLKLAFASIQKVEISRYEIDNLDVKNYTIDTIKHFKSIYYEDELFYIMGMDQCNSFDKWKNADLFNNYVQLVTFNRIGYEKNDNFYKYKFIEINVNPVNFSSTDIRNGNLNGLDKNVLAYISSNGLYLETMIKPYMKEKRYLHSISVAKTAILIAKANKLDEKKAFVAGILHDIAKEMPYENSKKIMEQYYPEHLDKPVPIWHQWLSAYLASKNFLITDEEILSAISKHTTGSIEMSLLDMTIYCADKYEPLRDYDTSNQLNICCKNIQDGFSNCLKEFYEYSKEKQIEIDPIFYEIYRIYGKEDVNE